jgi:hypothetical protein
MNAAESETRLTIDEISVDRDGRKIATLVAADGGIATIPLALLPEGARINHVIVASFLLDPDSSRERARRVRSLQHRLFNRDRPS